MATIIKTKINLECDEYNYRQLAKLREKTRNDFQPCYDERFLPARVNYDLMGDVLAAKHELNMISQGKKVKGFNKKRVAETPVNSVENLRELFLFIYKKTSEAIWKITTKK